MKFFNKDKIKSRVLYAVNAGTHIGNFIIFFKENVDNYEGLKIGGPKSFESVCIPKKDINDGLKNKILEKAQKLPKDLVDTLQREWTYRKNESNH